MSQDIIPSEVADGELLARFVVRRWWINSDDQTPKQDAFIPPKDLNLSVTRHTGLSQPELWERGNDVAVVRGLILYGRADISALLVRNQALTVQSAPSARNRNHAHLSGWPTDKPSQKIIAAELARSAQYVPKQESIR